MKRLIEWVCCPMCGSKTRIKIRSDTELTNFPSCRYKIFGRKLFNRKHRPKSGTNGSRIIEWATLYQSLGDEGLKTTQKLSSYSAETKCSAVCDYLSGKGTLREIQKKYGIRSDK